MNLNGIKLNKKQIIIIVILVAGLAAGVFLVQTRQIFKSRASDEIFNNIGITGADKEKCSGSGASRTCETDSETIELDLGALKNLTR